MNSSTSVPSSLPVRFLERRDWVAFWITFLIALAVYTYTLAPTVTLEDAGELAVAADYLGVPHPPGYPIWTILAWFFQWIFGWVTFQGHPNPAWGVAFMSGFFGALACGTVALLISRSGRDLVLQLPTETPPKTRTWMAFGGGALFLFLGLFLLVSSGYPAVLEPKPDDPIGLDRGLVLFLLFASVCYLLLCFAAEFILKWNPRFKSGLPAFIPMAYLGAVILGAIMGAILFVGVWMAHMGTILFAAVGMALFVGTDALLGTQGNRFRGGTLEDVARLAPWAGVAAGLLLAFSPRMWSQCTIVEVYSLNGFFMVLILLLTYAWMCDPTRDRLLYITAFIFGLGLTNHQSLLFMLPFPLLAIAFRRPPLFVNGLAAMLAVIAAVILQKAVAAGTAPPSGKIPDPKSLGLKIGMIYPVVLAPALIFFAVKRRHISLITMLCLHIALCVIIVRPTPDGQEEAVKLGRTLLVGLGALIALGIPLIFHFTEKARFQLWAKLYGILGAMIAGLSFIAYMPIASEQNPPMNWGYARTLKGFKHMITRGQYEAIDPVENFKAILRQLNSGEPHLKYFQTMTARDLKDEYELAVMDINNRFDGSEKDSRMAELEKSFDVKISEEAQQRYLHSKFFFFKQMAAFFWNPKDDEPADQFSMVNQYTIPLSFLGLLPLFFLFRQNDAFRGWLYSTMVAFFFVTIVFVIFQFPNLDVQDLFIKRVQYMPAHAVFAVWIGYGLLLALLILRAYLPSPQVIQGLALAAVVAFPAVGLWRDAYNPLHLSTLGASNLRDHDFGWQFGRYQLEGIEGILAELSEDESKPPDLSYPPSMGPDAIFFGGTDPGRFVPTYMIYSAKVRPDVYLITQNALADGTYMQVMRDLYGNQIWMPSTLDSNDAFKQYYADVQSGRVNAGADLEAENGMMKVSGVQGVMQINAILCRQIWEKNKDQHEFFVEESYPIPWMYPYLTPHGLILKLNSEPTQITTDLVRKDFEFWEWYIARLKANPKFSRDVIAQKTFSKLRGAIAGLYASRGMAMQAEAAFLQALDLYPMSPEACMRLAQMYMQTQRVYDAEVIARRLLESDPGNSHIQGFVNNVGVLKRYDRERKELEKKLRTNRSDYSAAFKLVGIYGAMNMGTRLDPLVRSLVRIPNLPAETLLDLNTTLETARRYAAQIELLDVYVKRFPADYRGPLERAVVHLKNQKAQEAVNDVYLAIKMGGERARTAIRDDKRFGLLMMSKDFQRLVAPRASPTAPGTGLPLPGMSLPGLPQP